MTELSVAAGQTVKTGSTGSLLLKAGLGQAGWERRFKLGFEEIDV